MILTKCRGCETLLSPGLGHWCTPCIVRVANRRERRLRALANGYRQRAAKCKHCSVRGRDIQDAVDNVLEKMEDALWTMDGNAVAQAASELTRGKLGTHPAVLYAINVQLHHALRTTNHGAAGAAAVYAGVVAMGEWAARLHWRHEVRQKSRPACYIAMLPTIIEIGRAHGYAISVHGSLTRDLDLVASPWSDDAAPAVTLAKAIALATGGAMNPAPTEKPHGRRAWMIYTSDETKVDLSVMPRQP